MEPEVKDPGPLKHRTPEDVKLEDQGPVLCGPISSGVQPRTLPPASTTRHRYGSATRSLALLQTGSHFSPFGREVA